MNEKKIEILSVKILADQISCDYSLREGDVQVMGTSSAKEPPTVGMLKELPDLTEALCTVFYLGMRDKAWRKENVIATGFKLRYLPDTSKGCIVTGKIRLLSGKWVGVSTDLIGFEDNIYNVDGLESATAAIALSVKNYFFKDFPIQGEIELEGGKK